ncbi:DNA cytosine methyltransferase [Methyloligella solikamskensis]|uniref:DNA (cytosine-5-)-methyltransferase n=1 Tax=Methyloligella solikamskensis TaxID=1177756 RepID=A0ABW3JBK8_9HYPH
MPATTFKAPRCFARGRVKVVDLFCGVGGLSHGLLLEGLQVVAGVDNDSTCEYAFEKNNGSTFIKRNIARFTSGELLDLFGDASVRVLVGCAPCQPYSSLNRRDLDPLQARERWYPLYRFTQLIRKVKPEIVSMENVPDLANEAKYEIFATFIKILRRLDYHVSFRTVDASRFGVPQKRQRLVLLASKLGPIKLIDETHREENLVTVRQAISDLPPLADGAADANDPLHRSSRLSQLNKKRIRATPEDGGSAKSWSQDLMPDCYRRASGRSYMSTVYGRMRWDSPAPTMTTHCTTLGTGRFGHPVQDRAISLREAARIQSFPDYYEFSAEGEIRIGDTARHIGNAVPVLLGRAIGKSLKRHIREHVRSIK